jgi:hypothetical protein
MKAFVAVLAVFAVLCAPLAIAGFASAAGERDLTPVVEQGSTDRLGGGDWISVRAGDARVGVVYGTAARMNKLYVFAEYKRFLGGADIYDGRDNYLRTTGIPVYTVFGQSFDGLIEFQDRDANGLLNFYRFDHNDTTGDAPAKATQLTRAWRATTPAVEVVGNTTWVNFTVETRNVPYDVVWSPLRRPGTRADGVLDHLAFTFHLNITVRDVSGEVPWYRVTVNDGGSREITHVEFLGNRTYSGQAVAMGAKYDHLIEGWDFAGPTDLLALETRAFVGYYVPQRVGEFVHMAYTSQARDPSGYRQPATDTTMPLVPRSLTRDVVYFDDYWDRVGRLVWRSDVTVDGSPHTMLFQVQGGESFATRHAGAAFFGFAIRGAYIYPSGAVIVHDPSMDAVSDLWNLPETLNLTPFTVLAIQVGIAAIAMGAAVLVRAKGRRAR